MLDIKSFENSSAQRLSLDFTAHSTACGGRRHELVIFCLNSLRAGEAVDGVGWGGWVGVGGYGTFLFNVRVQFLFSVRQD